VARAGRYDIERAGRLIDAGMVWPEPRRFDSLPRARDNRALDQALAYLIAAERQRPNHPHAYRLAGQIYAARGDWQRSAAVLGRARALAPNNPLLAWEASMAYEQMLKVIAGAPRAPLLSTLGAGRLDVPPGPINTAYCHDQRPETCYFRSTSFTQPYAACPGLPQVSIPVLYLHPPAKINSALSLPRDHPALSFVLGLDPAARVWNSDGATFRVWVTPQGGPPALAYERTIDGASIRRGWIPDWVNLAPWSGQAITLTLETNAGPAGDASSDWYGWGDVALTTVDAARYSALLPQIRMEQARRLIR
jgi:hypothetical protein